MERLLLKEFIRQCRKQLLYYGKMPQENINKILYFFIKYKAKVIWASLF